MFIQIHAEANYKNSLSSDSSRRQQVQRNFPAWRTIVTWADPDTHKFRRWKASSSPKVIYVAYIPTMFTKHNEQVNLFAY